MLRLFKRAAKASAVATGEPAALGRDALAQRMAPGSIVPAGCVGVALGTGGLLARVGAGTRLPPAGDVFCFHPGPYTIEFAPFAASPEMGLQLVFVIDAPDPRVAQQRFDLYLASEAPDCLRLSSFAALVETTVQRELAQGSLELPPCTTPDEWNVFRGGFNRILYQRFGITVDDCLPVDLGDQVDYAAILRARAAAPEAAPADQSARRQVAPAVTDALAQRRLFLELPALASALRQLCLPQGQGYFQRQQQLLQRLDHVALSIDTMPALALAGPGQPLAPDAQAQRALASEQAAAALDEAWSVLARLAGAPAELLDDADRIVANLELHCATRRAAA